MSAEVYQSTSTGTVAAFSPVLGNARPGTTLTATISGATMCGGCVQNPTTGLYAKVIAGTINTTFALALAVNNTTWNVAAIAGLSVGVYSNAGCTTFLNFADVLAQLEFSCVLNKWQFKITATNPDPLNRAVFSLFFSSFPLAACDVVANTLSIASTNASCALGVIATGGTVSIPLCP